MRFLLLLALVPVALLGRLDRAAADEPGTRTADVIYGRKFGMALTMDVFTPKTGANGAAVIMVVSGGWVSDHKALNPGLIANFIA